MYMWLPFLPEDFLLSIKFYIVKNICTLCVYMYVLLYIIIFSFFMTPIPPIFFIPYYIIIHEVVRNFSREIIRMQPLIIMRGGGGGGE